MSALAELKNYIGEMVELQAAAAIAHWDARTYMPERGVETRARVTGKLSRLAFERLVSPKFGELLAQAEKELDSASEVERAMVRMGKRDYERAKAIPPDFYQKFVELCTRAESVWEKAKAKANFELFRPYLAEIVDMVREMARMIGYKEHPYDALLEEYEPGMTTAQVAEILRGLREKLVPFVRELLDRGHPASARPRGKVSDPKPKGPLPGGPRCYRLRFFRGKARRFRSSFHHRPWSGRYPGHEPLQRSRAVLRPLRGPPRGRACPLRPGNPGGAFLAWPLRRRFLRNPRIPIAVLGKPNRKKPRVLGILQAQAFPAVPRFRPKEPLKRFSAW
jgi:hypothetical protein